MSTVLPRSSRPPGRTPSRTGALTGTGTLTWLALRRGRLGLPLWVFVTGGLVAVGPGALADVYPTAADRASAAAAMNANGSLRAFYGPVLDDSLGGLVAWRFGVFAAVLAALASLLTVIRHTREEEETGRQEMLSAGAVGRRAPLTAALLTALAVNGAIALLITASLARQGLAGALALGLATGATGMVLATTAALAAQLTESARLAKGLTGAALGLAFALRAAGDARTPDGSSVLTWLSPLGWAGHVRPYAGERWWVLLLPLAAVLLQTCAAYALTARRDLGASFLPTRPGPADGRLGSAGALALRLQRGSLLGWSLGFLLAGLVFGGMAEGAAELVGGNARTREIFARMGGQTALTSAFLATLVSLLGMVAALFAVGSVLRAHGEETSGRAEPLLAHPLGRLRWAAGHLVIAFGGSALILALGGLGLTLSYGHDPGPLLGAALVQLPAVWTLAGLAVLLWGASPRTARAAWGAAGICLALGWVGPALGLPQTVLDLSPYGHLPKLPGQDMNWPPVLTLTALAAALTAAGLTGLRHRDLTG
ncbi:MULTISPECIES: ABC transporter permease [unclassified Streptomyces]|uniref:ABC transporter permease n=1 Tax=unclassified Streptomyces TaxID=2593676 RepID=UPI00166116DF|nr:MULTISPECIES: ABC transporter permease [unclassified Streptomyces]MBD0712044.1 ABC transporter permease [Streptomyces sp. CBMA291]MBD0717971.1 ABC transporter permease [Streptomyces sp. CBMA370]